MNKNKFWQNIYQTKSSKEVSWFVPRLAKSLELIKKTGIQKNGSVIDLGAGASTLVDDLLDEGFTQLTALDIASDSLEISKKRLGVKAKKIKWLEADILKADLPENAFDLWHDRAVFHFLTKPEDRKVYLEKLGRSLKSGGFVIMASFSLEGPQKCSGLDVQCYSAETMSKEIGSGFMLVRSDQERHHTPFNTVQDFVYCLFKRA